MPKAKRKLLIVDDEVAIRVSLSQIFSSIGHTVRWAADGFAALHEIRNELPDIILCDLNMAGMSGFEFLSVVRRRFPTIRVVAMSGAFTGDDIPDGVAADAFYEKGTYLGSLLQIVEGMSDVTSSHPHASGLTPIWIASNGHDPAGEAYVMITCPECLRSFPQVLEKAVCPIFGTHCKHCDGLIHYAIVPPTMPASRQPVPVKSASEMPTLLSVVNLAEC
jgi:CheY-like chemotaxis protein